MRKNGFKLLPLLFCLSSAGFAARPDPALQTLSAANMDFDLKYKAMKAKRDLAAPYSDVYFERELGSVRLFDSDKPGNSPTAQLKRKVEYCFKRQPVAWSSIRVEPIEGGHRVLFEHAGFTCQEFFTVVRRDSDRVYAIASPYSVDCDPVIETVSQEFNKDWKPMDLTLQKESRPDTNTAPGRSPVHMKGIVWIFFPSEDSQ